MSRFIPVSLLLFLLFLTTSYAPPASEAIFYPNDFSPETRTMIAVIDTGILPVKGFSQYMCRTGHRDFTRTDLIDRNGHGSNIFGLVARQIDPKRHCIVVLKWMDQPSFFSFSSGSLIVKAMVHAQQIGVKYINLSAGGDGFDPIEKEVVVGIIKAGIHFVMSAGNESHDLGKYCNKYPTCYVDFKSPFYHSVEAIGEDGKRLGFSNYGGPVNEKAQGWEQDNGSGFVMSGTSQAAANFTSELVAREYKQWRPY